MVHVSNPAWGPPGPPYAADMFTPAAFPVGSRTKVKDRLWQVVHSCYVAQPSSVQVQFVNPESGMLASAKLPAATEGIDSTTAEVKPAEVRKSADGWIGYLDDELSVGDTLLFGGRLTYIHRVEVDGDTMTVQLVPDKHLHHLQRRVESLFHKGDFEQAGKVMYGEIPRWERENLMHLWLPRDSKRSANRALWRDFLSP